MARAYLDIAPELLVEFLKTLTRPDSLQLLRVTRHALPAGTKLVHVGLIGTGGTYVRLTLESPHLPDGAILKSPELTATCLTAAEIVTVADAFAELKHALVTPEDHEGLTDEV